MPTKRVADMTPGEYEAHKIKRRLEAWRKNQSEEVRKNRLEKARIREAKKRAEMTEEEKKANRKYKREYNAKRRKTDPAFRAMGDIRNRLRHARERRHITRADLKTSEMLGCTWKEFADYIESLFDDRMTWENKGQFTWHLDHVIPLAYFDLSKPDEEKVASNVLNHQPLWHDENMKKGATMPPVSSIPRKLWRMALELDADFAKREP